jgi:hypothetical protein
MPDEPILRGQVREAIKTGRIPARSADRTYGGPGVGALCSVCNLPVRNSAMEMQIEFGREAEAAGIEKYHAHVRCFAAWELERGSVRSL